MPTCFGKVVCCSGQKKNLKKDTMGECNIIQVPILCIGTYDSVALTHQNQIIGLTISKDTYLQAD